ncbi:hypothetical protein [Modestobacter lapidis]|nr:hypothetical protein [Modestobacter lapidis]
MPDSYLPFPKQRRRRSGGDRMVSIEVGRRSAWMRGNGLASVLDEIGVPRMWCPRQKCLTCPVDRVDDILALVEHRDRRMVELVAVDR